MYSLNLLVQTKKLIKKALKHYLQMQHYLFLYRNSFFMPKCCSSKLSCSIKAMPFCWQSFFNLPLVSLRILTRLALSFLKIISEKTCLVDGENLLRFLRIFLNEFSELNCSVKSFLWACTINILGLQNVDFLVYFLNSSS